jgi:lysophospholipase L1-like esterase
MRNHTGGPGLSIRKKVVFALLPLLLLFSLLEVGVRLYRAYTLSADDGSSKYTRNIATLYQSHPFLTYCLNSQRPGCSEQGFRDTRIFQNDFSGVRIACLGGSSTYGTCVGPADSYPAQLEQALARNGAGAGPYEVINAGLAGYSTYNLAGLLSFRVVDLKPDVCIFYTGFNDAWNRLHFAGFKPDGSHAMKAWDYPDLKTPWWRSSALLDSVATASGNRHISIPHIHMICWRPMSGKPADNLRNSSSEPFRRNLQTLIHICRGHGITPVVCTQATDFTNHPVPGFESEWPLAMEETESIVRSVAAEQGVELIDIRAAMGDKKEYFADCLHMNEQGNAERARIIADHLREHVLPAKGRAPGSAN